MSDRQENKEEPLDSRTNRLRSRCERYGPRKTAPRREWKAADYVREDLSTADLADFLEADARGYSGRLREHLCTAAYMIRDLKSREDVGPTA